MKFELFQNIFVDSAQEVHSILQFVLGTIRFKNHEVGLSATSMLVTDMAGSVTNISNLSTKKERTTHALYNVNKKLEGYFKSKCF